jgi:hypothetical protein
MAAAARISMLLLTGLLACGGEASSSPPAGDPGSASPAEFIAPEEACDTDADCVMTDFPGCCACCGCAYPYAIRGDALAAERDRCAEVDCAAAQEEAGCAAEECVGCPLTEERFEAVCRAGRCTPEPG